MQREEAMEVQSLEDQSPEDQSPEDQSPEVQSPEVQSPEVQSPEVQSPEVDTTPQFESPCLTNINYDLLPGPLSGPSSGTTLLTYVPVPQQMLFPPASFFGDAPGGYVTYGVYDGAALGAWDLNGIAQWPHPPAPILDIAQYQPQAWPYASCQFDPLPPVSYTGGYYMEVAFPRPFVGGPPPPPLPQLELGRPKKMASWSSGMRARAKRRRRNAERAAQAEQARAQETEKAKEQAQGSEDVVNKTLAALNINAGEKPSTFSDSLIKNRRCIFCKSNGETRAVYSTHCLKNEKGEVVCPILQKWKCPICKKTGKEAHTEKYCPENTTKRAYNRQEAHNAAGSRRRIRY